MAVQSPYLLPGMNPVAVVQNPNNNQVPDTSVAPMAVGRQGDLVVSEFHGRLYNKGIRGNVFWGTSGVAGAAPLAPGGTTAGFVLLNPATSQKYLEVEQLRIAGGSTETVVVAGFALEGSVQTPTGTLTGATTSSLPLGTGGLIGATQATSTANGKVYLAATIVAMTFLGNLGLTIQATTSPPTPAIVDFNGSLILAPGMCINLVTTITNTGKVIVCDWIWSEHYL